MPPTQAEANVRVAIAAISQNRNYTGLLTAFEQYCHGFGFLPGDDSLHTGANNRGLFTCDTFECMAQVLFVVHRDLCDGHDASVCGCGGIEPSTQSCFEDRQLNAGVSKRDESNGSQLLEKSGKRFDPFVSKQLL